MRVFRLLGLCCWVVVALVVHIAPAAAEAALEAEDLETPRGLSLGSGSRASTMGTSALAYNVANLSLGKLYHVDSISGYRVDSKQWNTGGAVVDSFTTMLAAGLSARGVFTGNKSAYSGFDIKLGLALPIGKMLSIGVAGRYLRFRPKTNPAAVDMTDTTMPSDGTATDDTTMDGSTPATPAPAATNDRLNARVDGFTLDAAIRLTLFKALHIAALGNNLVNRHSPLVPQQVGGSVALSIGSALNIGGDLLADLSTFDKVSFLTGGGLEYLAGGSFPLRAGYRFDTGRESHSVGAGFGYTSRHFGTDIGLRQGVAGGSETRLLMSLRYHVQ